MLGKMIIRSAGFAVLAGIVWNMPAAHGVITQLQDFVTSGNMVTAAFSKINPLAVDQPATPYTPVGHCNVTLVVNTTGAPRGAVTEIRHAAATLAAVTGMTIKVVRGTVADSADHTKIPVVFKSSQTIASMYSGHAAYALTKTRHFEADSGTVILTTGLYVNKDAYLNLNTGTGPDSRYIVLLHELGHVAGLDHSDTASSLMARSPNETEGISEQDLTDLRAATQSCR